jgi:hypothetical protein
MSETTIRPRNGVAAWLSARIRRWQRDLSDRVHAAGDERARHRGWEVIESTGRFGFGTRTYRDPRFDHRGGQLPGGTVRATARSHTGFRRDNGAERNEDRLQIR